jgi:mono/diheme cytochrome c family protein
MYKNSRTASIKILLLVFSYVFIFSISKAALADELIETFVYAATGGTFSDDPDNPNITIIIPPGALSNNAELNVNLTKRPQPVGANQFAASAAYRIQLEQEDDEYEEDGKLKLSQPMQVIIKASSAPMHPQLGEMAYRKGSKWQRLHASLYRKSDTTVLALTTKTKAELRVVHRSLQARSGAEVERGRTLYLDETWGSEAFWGDRFQLHEVLNNVTPFQAVNIGAQIDISKVPQPIVEVMLSDDFATKQAALNDPATTRALIKAGAVFGVRGFFNDTANPDKLTSVGLTCALCHVTAKPTAFQLAADAEPVFLPMGPAVFGPPNTRLDAGLLLSFTPRVQNETPELLPQYTSWGRGMFDPRFFEGNPFNDDVNNPSSIPPHWNFIDLAEQDYAITWIGVLQTRPDNHSLASGPECGIDLVLGVNGAWGTDNATIKNIEIANDLPQLYWDRLDAAEQSEPGNVLQRQDLLDVEAFMQSLVSPAPGAFDETRAAAGLALFYGKANCVYCHQTAEGTGDAGFFTHIVENPPQGLLSIGIRTPGLRGLALTAPYFHDGSAATLANVMARYASTDIPEVPELDEHERAALVEYLKSL